MSAVTPANGPGAQLQQRREAMGLSLQQAAAQLNLKAAVIEQLESQQWDARVGPTFIRGYLRQYCRLLKLDEAQMLSQFDQLLAALPQATPMHSFSKKTSRDAAESRFMLATYFLLVLLIGLFLIWFWQTHMLNDQPVSMLPELEHSAVSAVDSAVDSAPADIRSTEVTPSLPMGRDGVTSVLRMSAGALSTALSTALTALCSSSGNIDTGWSFNIWVCQNQIRNSPISSTSRK